MNFVLPGILSNKAEKSDREGDMAETKLQAFCRNLGLLASQFNEVARHLNEIKERCRTFEVYELKETLNEEVYRDFAELLEESFEDIKIIVGVKYFNMKEMEKQQGRKVRP